MTKVDLTLDLPDRIARDAEAAGLLSAAAIARLVRAEIRRQAAERLGAGAARAGAPGAKPLSMAEIQTEVDAVRKAGRHS
jgi:hypothetical protein